MKVFIDTNVILERDHSQLGFYIEDVYPDTGMESVSVSD